MLESLAFVFALENASICSSIYDVVAGGIGVDFINSRVSNEWVWTAEGFATIMADGQPSTYGSYKKT